MAKILLKFAGPDNNDNFKCLSVKGRLVVDPGKIYNRKTIKYLNSHFDVTTIEPKFETQRRVFIGPKGEEF